MYGVLADGSFAALYGVVCFYRALLEVLVARWCTVEMTQRSLSQSRSAGRKLVFLLISGALSYAVDATHSLSQRHKSVVYQLGL